MARPKFVRKPVSNKEIWLKTPHLQDLKNADGRVIRDEDGNPQQIPLCVCLKQPEAIRLIKKGRGGVVTDAEGNIKALKEYTLASQSEIDAHLKNTSMYTEARGRRIRARQLRRTQAFMPITMEQFQEATGTAIAKTPESVKVEKAAAVAEKEAAEVPKASEPLSPEVPESEDVEVEREEAPKNKKKR